MIYLYGFLLLLVGGIVGMVGLAIVQSGANADLRTENAYMKRLLQKVCWNPYSAETMDEIEEFLKEVDQ